MSDWAGLHRDILFLILKKIIFIDDLVAVGSVCKSWRELVRNNKHNLRPLLPVLISTNRGQCRQWKDYTSMKNLYIPEIFGRKCIGLNYGWVLTISLRGEMNLVHPLSQSRTPLPNGEPYFSVSTCAALSANPSQTSNFVVMIVYLGKAVYLRHGGLGDHQWTPIPDRMPHINDLIYYEDRFYGIDINGGVWVFGVSERRDCLPVTDPNPIFTVIFYRKKYIVVSERDLLVVCFSSDWPYEFHVYKVDLINGNHMRVRSLGDRSIFVGHTTSMSVDISEFPRGGLIKSNHIYFADLWGSYSLEDEQFKEFQVPRSSRDSTFWFIPSF